MTEKMCWICEKNPANSGEHIIKKSVLDKIFGKVEHGKYRYLKHATSNKPKLLQSHTSNNLKFRKSICSQCNGALTQQHDISFSTFIDNIFDKETSIIQRGKINLGSMTNNDEATRTGVALYFLKIFGCLLIENNMCIDDSDFKSLRESILSDHIYLEGIYVAFHRDIKKLALGGRNTVAQIHSVTGNTILWTIDIGWLTMIISYPVALSDEKYGQAWLLNDDIKIIKIGKLT